jgi:hypothetical protein
VAALTALVPSGKNTEYQLIKLAKLESEIVKSDRAFDSAHKWPFWLVEEFLKEAARKAEEAR